MTACGFLNHPDITVAKTDVQNVRDCYLLIDDLMSHPKVRLAGEYLKNDYHGFAILRQVLILFKNASVYHLLTELQETYKIKSIQPHRLINLYQLD